MKKPTDKDESRIKQSRQAAKKGMQKKNNKKTDNTRLYYIVIGVFIALCAYAVIEIVLNPKKSLSETPAIDQNKVSIHNSKGYQFKQGLIDFWNGKTLADAKSMFQGGFSSSPQIQQCAIDNQNKEHIPDQFDAHKNWPNCVSTIRNQGVCASGPILQVTSAISQRKCIHQNGEMKELSAQAILACNEYRQDKKCQEGYANQAFYHLMEKGVPYQEDCPYDPSNLQCTEKCKESKFKVHDMCLLSSFDSIRREIMTNGPVVAFINPTTDLLSYESGFYHQVQGQPFKGQHILNIVGWTGRNINEDSWIVQNSWGTGWGQYGKARVQMRYMPMYALKASVEYKSSEQTPQIIEEAINIDNIPNENGDQKKEQDKDQTKIQAQAAQNQVESEKKSNKQKEQNSKNEENKDKMVNQENSSKDKLKQNHKEQKLMDEKSKAMNENSNDEKSKPQDEKPKDEKPKPQDEKLNDEKPKPEDEKPKDEKPKPQDEKLNDEKPEPQDEKPKDEKSKPYDEKPKDEKPEPQDEKPKDEKSKPQDEKLKDEKANSQGKKKKDKKAKSKVNKN